MSTFLDEVVIEVSGGRGGRGSVSFRREKYVPLGGPDGGDGGRGGAVVLVADSGDATLSGFRERRRFAAKAGGDGRGALKSGERADDIRLSVPPGTQVRDAESNELLGDLDYVGAELVVARGGRGGRGNARFKSSTRQAPRLGELGEKGEARRLHLELKLIADIGLVGLPNAGKSTFLAAVTGAHPKIGAYPFTTLHPNLGVADRDGRSYVIADVPGLIEGAHRGAGLGIEFLRHLERTRVLLHLIDVSQGADAARAAVAEVESELRQFSEALVDKPRLIAFNKVDIPEAAEAAQQLARDFPEAMSISAAGDRVACDALLDAAIAQVDLVRAATPSPAPTADNAAPRHRLYKFESSERAPVVTREGDVFRVSHRATEKLVDITDMDNEEAVRRLQRRMERAGVDAALREAGCHEGDTVVIGSAEFIYYDDWIAS